MARSCLASSASAPFCFHALLPRFSCLDGCVKTCCVVMRSNSESFSLEGKWRHSPLSFQTCMTFCLQQTIKEDIIKNVGKQTTLAFHCMYTKQFRNFLKYLLLKIMIFNKLFPYFAWCPSDVLLITNSTEPVSSFLLEINYISIHHLMAHLLYPLRAAVVIVLN